MRIKIVGTVLLAFLLVGCGENPETSVAKPSRDVAGYNELFKETFRSNQLATTEVPKKGVYDFELTANADGEAGKIDTFVGKTFGEAFRSFSTRLYGDYDFQNPTAASFVSTIKAFLNKENTWQWDFDMELGIDSSGSLQYEIRNLDPRILSFLQIDEWTTKAVTDAVEQHKWQKQVTEVGTEVLREIISTIRESAQNSPLHQSSKEEERKLIDAIAESETIQVLSGSWINDSTERISFRFNADNFAKLLTEVGKILGKGNENKDFSGDAELFGKTIVMDGTMDIRENRIVDSSAKILVRLGWVSQKTGEKEADDLVIKITRFSFPDPSRYNFDLDTQLYANSAPQDVLRLRIKWLIK